MAEIAILHQYKTLSIDELYNLLFKTIQNMLDASDGKDHYLFLQCQNEVIFIRELIEEKRAEIRQNGHDLTTMK